MKIERLQKEVYAIAKSKGWHDQLVSFGDQLAKMHAELTEAWEWHMVGNPASDHIPEFSGIEEELADLIILVLDSAETHGHDVAGAIRAKCEFNKTRPYRQRRCRGEKTT